MPEILEIKDSNYRDLVLNSPIPVLLDCWAEWCVPCKAIEPHIKEIAQQYDGKLRVAKLNVDQNMMTAAYFRVTSLPTVLLVKNGRVAESIVGAVPKGKLFAMVQRHVD